MDLRACAVSLSKRLLFFEVPDSLSTQPLLSSSEMKSKKAGSWGVALYIDFRSSFNPSASLSSNLNINSRE